MKKILFVLLVVLFGLPAMAYDIPIVHNYYTTNLAPVVAASGGVTTNAVISIMATNNAATAATAGSLQGNLQPWIYTNAINSGVFNLNASNAILFDGVPMIYGNASKENFFIGQAGPQYSYSFVAGHTPDGGAVYLGPISGTANIGIGFGVFQDLHQGSANVAIGDNAADQLNFGWYNVAIGAQAMNSGFQYSSNNVIIGGNAWAAGGRYARNNVVIGYDAVEGLAVGNNTNLIVIGANAGGSYSGSESSDILIGSPGSPNENNVIRIGDPNIHTDTYLVGNIHYVGGSYVNNTNVLIPVGLSYLTNNFAFPALTNGNYTYAATLSWTNSGGSVPVGIYTNKSGCGIGFDTDVGSWITMTNLTTDAQNTGGQWETSSGFFPTGYGGHWVSLFGNTKGYFTASYQQIAAATSLIGNAAGLTNIQGSNIVGTITGNLVGLTFTNGAGASFKVGVNAATNGFNFIPQ